jgi:hypothetical protein
MTLYLLICLQLTPRPHALEIQQNPPARLAFGLQTLDHVANFNDHATHDLYAVQGDFSNDLDSNDLHSTGSVISAKPRSILLCSIP